MGDIPIQVRGLASLLHCGWLRKWLNDLIWLLERSRKKPEGTCIASAVESGTVQILNGVTASISAWQYDHDVKCQCNKRRC